MWKTAIVRYIVLAIARSLKTNKQTKQNKTKNLDILFDRVAVACVRLGAAPELFLRCTNTDTGDFHGCCFWRLLSIAPSGTRAPHTHAVIWNLNFHGIAIDFAWTFQLSPGHGPSLVFTVLSPFFKPYCDIYIFTFLVYNH